MVDHVRTVIRDAVVAALAAAAGPVLGTRIHAGRVHSYQPADLPALSVQIVSDELLEEWTGAGRYAAEFRRAILQLEGAVSDATDFDQVLDEIDAETAPTIAALFDGGALAGVHLGAWLSAEKSASGDAGVPAATIRIRWEVRYRVDPADPTTLIT